MRLAYLSIGRHIHTERWLTYFARKGYEVHLLTVQPGAIEGVTVHDITSHFGPKPWRYLTSLIKVRAILGRLKPDLLHTHFLTGYGYWGAFSGYRPHMITVWGDDVYVTPFESKLKHWLARRALSGADYVTGDSVDIVDACIRLGAPADRSEVVQWGVDFQQFNPEVRRPVREALDIPPGVPVVLSTRSFTQAYYNIDLIVDAIPEIRKAYPDAVFVIAGNEGSDAAIRARARERGVEQACRFVGRIPHGELPGYLTASEVFLTVPSVDATAVSLLEAMAAGSAIVASNLPSAAEWIFDRQSGLLVPPRDLPALVNAITTFLADPGLRAACGRRAVEIVRAKADHDVNMQQCEAIYRRLIRDRSASRGTAGPAREARTA